MPADRRHVRRLRLVAGGVLLASLALAAPAQAGRLVVTGHDAESHCIREEAAVRPAACAFVAASVNWVRAGAPDPTKPVLILDRGAQDFQKSVDQMNASGVPVPYQVVDPRSPALATLPINTATYSAILIASSKNDAADPTPQDLNEVGSTPDTDANNPPDAHTDRFFDAGGVIALLWGGQPPPSDSARYYRFLRITRAGGFASLPTSLTPVGRAIGFQDARAHPGELDSINCCLTHISFELPAPESALKVAEVDTTGHAVTLAAQTNDLANIEEPPSSAPAVFASAPGVPASGGGTHTGTIQTVAGGTKPICTTRTSVKIPLKRPKGVRFVKVAIHVNGRKTQFLSRKRIGTKSKVTVTVKLWKAKTTKVRVVVTTASGRKLTYRQSYTRCGSKR